MAGFYNTQVPTGAGITQLIEGASQSPLKPLSEAMTGLSNILDNRAKDQYTKTALDKLKGISSTQDYMEAMQTLDPTMLSKEGTLMVDKLGKNIQTAELMDLKQQQLGLDKLKTSIEMQKAMKTDTPEVIQEMSRLGFPLTQEGFAKYQQTKDPAGTKGFGATKDAFGNVLIYNKDTGEYSVKTPSGDNMPLSAPITNTTPTTTLETGEEVYIDRNGTPIINKITGKPIVKSYTKQSQVEKEQQKANLGKATYDKAQNVKNYLTKLQEQVKGSAWSTGLASIFSFVPTSPAYDAEATVKTLYANMAFDRLDEMRRNSKTGGALGQVSEKELELLKSSVANLDLGQSKEQILDNIKTIAQRYNRIMEKFSTYDNANEYGFGSDSQNDTINEIKNQLGDDYNPDKYDYKIVDGKILRKAK